MDASGIITDWNDQAEVILGWRSNEVLGQRMSEILSPATLSRSARDRPTRICGDQEWAGIESPVRDLGSAERWSGDSGGTGDHSALGIGSSTVFSAFIRDITDRKQAPGAGQRHPNAPPFWLQLPAPLARGSLRWPRTVGNDGQLQRLDLSHATYSGSSASDFYASAGLGVDHFVVDGVSLGLDADARYRDYKSYGVTTVQRDQDDAIFGRNPLRRERALGESISWYPRLTLMLTSSTARSPRSRRPMARRRGRRELDRASVRR